MRELTDLNEELCEDIARKANRRSSGLSHLRCFMARELRYMFYYSDLLTDTGRLNIQRELDTRT